MKTATVTKTLAKKTRPAELVLTTKASNSSLSSNGKMLGSSSVGDDVSVASCRSGEEEVVVKSQSPPWKKTFDYIADQAFNLFGVAYLSAIGVMAWYFMRLSNMNFFYEFQSALRLLLFHYHGLPFFGSLAFMITLRYFINNYMYNIILNRIYEGKNHKYTAYYCEWMFDAIKNTVMFCIGAYVAFGSHWFPVPTAGKLGWYPPQGGTIFDSNGDIVPTYAPALETIGHFEVTVDFVALITLCYDAITEYYEAQAQLRHGDNKQATTTTSFAEDFVHHTGVCFGALFLYITARDNCNAIAIIVLLGQFNDMCEFAALTLGLCKVWFFEKVFTPVLFVFWTISLLYVWPATLLPIFFEAIPIEHNFDTTVVLQLSLYQFGSVCIAGLFWAMHMFWLYKGILFLWRYNKGTFFQEKKLKFKKPGVASSPAAVPQYNRTPCIASGTLLKPTKEE